MIQVRRNGRCAMSVLWLTVLVWGTGLATAWGQEQKGPEPSQKAGQDEPQRWPRIEIEPKSLNVGEVFVGEDGKGEIKIRNTGDAELQILKVRSSCGCTAAKLKAADHRIPPGGEVTLPVTMKPSKIRQGDRFVKSITIMSNDPLQPALPVRVEAQVKVGVDAIPYSLIFKKMQYGEVRGQELKLKSMTGEAFKITGIQGGSGPVVLGYDRALEATEHTVNVSVGPMPDPNNMHLRLQINTTHSKMPTLHVPLLVEVEKLVTVSPPYLNLGRNEAGSMVERKVKFTTKDGQPIESVNVEVTRYPMDVEAHPVEGSPNEWILGFKIPEEMEARKLISPVLLTTNVDKAGPVKITLSVTVTGPAAAEPGGA
ncbi:MAG: DUF1573 domain-containing protein [Phycisphaerales bacterium]|nr:MAG: DUF1573 domain-containing protein [Phycisphaerales bacterium]